MIVLAPPIQQIHFSHALAEARQTYLQEALGAAVATLDIRTIDSELSSLAPLPLLSSLARKGLRGELIFAVPSILVADPRLLGFYRLTLGYSQKEFYASATGLGRFKSWETAGRVSPSTRDNIKELCTALNAAAGPLLEGIGLDRVSQALLDDLALLGAHEYVDFRNRIVSLTGIRGK